MGRGHPKKKGGFLKPPKIPPRPRRWGPTPLFFLGGEIRFFGKALFIWLSPGGAGGGGGGAFFPKQLWGIEGGGRPFFFFFFPQTGFLKKGKKGGPAKGGGKDGGEKFTGPDWAPTPQSDYWGGKLIFWIPPRLFLVLCEGKPGIKGGIQKGPGGDNRGIKRPQFFFRLGRGVTFFSQKKRPPLAENPRKN